MSLQGAECTAKGQNQKLIVPAKAAAAKPVKTAKARASGEDADGSSPKVKRAKSAYIFFGSEKRSAVKGLTSVQPLS